MAERSLCRVSYDAEPANSFTASRARLEPITFIDRGRGSSRSSSNKAGEPASSTQPAFCDCRSDSYGCAYSRIREQCYTRRLVGF